MTLIEKVVCVGIGGAGMAAVVAAAQNIIEFVKGLPLKNPEFIDLAQQVETIVNQLG